MIGLFRAFQSLKTLRGIGGGLELGIAVLANPEYARALTAAVSTS
jgi:hypothetical protein